VDHIGRQRHQIRRYYTAAQQLRQTADLQAQTLADKDADHAEAVQVHLRADSVAHQDAAVHERMDWWKEGTANQQSDAIDWAQDNTAGADEKAMQDRLAAEAKAIEEENSRIERLEKE